MAKPPRNYFRTGVEWLPLTALPSSGPALMTDESQTVQWLTDPPSKAAVDHDGAKLKPAFWAPVRYAD